MQNLHKIMGAKYQHAKPGLCHHCVFRRDFGEWEGYCVKRHKVLSAPKENTKQGRCSDFEGE